MPEQDLKEETALSWGWGGGEGELNLITHRKVILTVNGNWDNFIYNFCVFMA